MSDGTGRQTDFESMFSMITGYWVSQIVAVAADLSLAEHLEGSRLAADEIAIRENSDPDSTQRFLHACAALGLVTYEDGMFEGTPLLRTLHAGSDNSLRDLALALTSPGHWLPWGRFAATVRTGTSQTVEALGEGIFGYFGSHPAEAALFSGAMTDLSSPVITQCLPVIDVTGVGVVADVGAANGAFVSAMLGQHPQLRGIAFDLPHIAPGAAVEAGKRGVSARLEISGGDFFESVPAADLYLLKFILHDWDDDSCVSVLQNCRESMLPGGRVAIVEMVAGEPGGSSLVSLMDMNMLSMTIGRERGLDEFDDLLGKSGLRRVRNTPIQHPYQVIEAVAMD
ncbi:methyltransferase [Lentzea sp. NPDC034063]|uniref:methyltransferase n=1 Tax=unclassified Lentzea TaxID=2643253 RepID=UPI003401DE1B